MTEEKRSPRPCDSLEAFVVKGTTTIPLYALILVYLGGGESRE